jgi:hypothetical protein
MEIRRFQSSANWVDQQQIQDEVFSKLPVQEEAVKSAQPHSPTNDPEASGYIQALAEQIQSLAIALGGQAIPVVATSHEQLIEPMGTLLNATNVAIPNASQKEPLSELQALLQAFITKILSGASPDLNPLGTLTGQMLSQVPRTAGQPQASQKAAPPGMKHEEFVNKQKEINEAISKKDLGKMRSIATDQKFIDCASPEQKSAMVRALSEDSNSRPNEITFTALGGNDRMSDRNAINKIVGSSADSQEFRSIVEGAGVDVVQRAMAPSAKDDELRKEAAAKGDPKAKFPDKMAADIDTMSGAFGCSDLAANREQAMAGEKAIQKGYSPQEVISAREKISYLQSQKINPVSEDPLLSSVVSTDEKASMIYTMRHHDFRNDDKADRTIANLAMTCGSKEEYDALMSKAGNDVMSINEKEAKGKVEKLAAGYGRTDLVTDAAALKYENVLIDPAKREKYLGGAKEIEKPRTVQPSQTGDAVEDFKKTNQEGISAELERMDAVSRNETIFVNMERESQGKPMMNPVELRKEAAALAENKPKAMTSLGPVDVTDQAIKDACKREGLSDYTARNVVSQPCARAYERAGGNAAAFLASQIGPLEEKLQREVAIHGAFSPEANALRNQIDGIKQKMKPYMENINEIAGKFNNMYPPPTSAFDEIGKFFISLVENVFPALLNVIPYVGPALYAGYQGVRAIVYAAQGNFLGMFGSIASALPGIGSVIGGAMKGVFGAAGSLLSKGASAVGSIIRGDALGAFSSVAGGFDAFNKFGGALGNVLNIKDFGIGGVAGKMLGSFSKGVDFAAKGSTVVQGIVTGDVGKITSGVSGFVDQMDKLAKNERDVQKIFNEFQKFAPPNSAIGQVSNLFARAGQVTGAFVSGDFQKINKALGDLKLMNNLPIPDEVKRFVEGGAGFAERLQKGKVKEAFDFLSKSKDPLLHEAGNLFKDGDKFLGNLAGDLNKSLSGAGKVMSEFFSNPSINNFSSKMMEAFKLGELAQKTGFSSELLKAAQGGVPLLSDPAVIKALEFANGGTNLIKQLANSDFTRTLGMVGNAANNLLGSKEWNEITSMVSAGGNFMSALKNNQFTDALSKIVSTDPAIQNAISEVLDFSRIGSSFFSTIENPLLAPQLGSFINATEQTMPDIVNTMRGLAGGSSIFSALASGHFMESINSFESQLHDVIRFSGEGSPFAELEETARHLVDKGNIETELLQNLTLMQQQLSAENSGIEMRSVIGMRF